MRTSTRFRRCWISDKPLADLRSTAIDDLCRVRRSLVLVDEGGESVSQDGSVYTEDRGSIVGKDE